MHRACTSNGENKVLEVQKFGRETAYEGWDVRNVHCECEAHLTCLWKDSIRKVHPECKPEWMDCWNISGTRCYIADVNRIDCESIRWAFN
jgi:hypothetical protein